MKEISMIIPRHPHLCDLIQSTSQTSTCFLPARLTKYLSCYTNTSLHPQGHCDVHPSPKFCACHINLTQWPAPRHDCQWCLFNFSADWMNKLKVQLTMTHMIWCIPAAQWLLTVKLYARGWLPTCFLQGSKSMKLLHFLDASCCL
jgi:hypothetical protein